MLLGAQDLEEFTKLNDFTTRQWVSLHINPVLSSFFVAAVAADSNVPHSTRSCVCAAALRLTLVDPNHSERQSICCSAVVSEHSIRNHDFGWNMLHRPDLSQAFLEADVEGH